MLQIFKPLGKGVTPNSCLCFVLINRVLFNLLSVWILL